MAVVTWDELKERIRAAHPLCLACLSSIPHLWHDQGGWNGDNAEDYYPGGKHARPLYAGERTPKEKQHGS